MTQEAEASTGASDLAPPYMPFKTFTNLLIRMQQNGVPRRLDSDYLKNMSGATRSQLMAGLKWFGLLDAEDRPSKTLTELVQAGEDRPAAVADLWKQHYGWALALARENATQGELDEAFRKLGVTGSTTRKATAFYLQGAKYAGLPNSPHFRETRASSGPTRSRSGTKKQKGDAATTPKPDDKKPDPLSNLTADERRRQALFDVLLKKVDEADEVNDALLDRLERIAGTLPGGPSEGK
jgi:hypothetical protein